MQTNQVYEVKIKDIEISDLNVRVHDKEKDLSDLAKSIEQFGLIQPVVLMGQHGSPPYQLIVGQRRFLATKDILKKDTIQAIFRRKSDDLNAKILSLVENIHRVELNLADKSEAITELYNKLNKDINKVASRLGCSASTVREYVKIEELATEKGKRYLREGKIGKEDLKRVIKLSEGSHKKANELIDEISKLSKYEKDRALEFVGKNKGASTNKIVEEAKKPRYEVTLFMNLTIEVDEALNEAQKILNMERESIALKALYEWLEEKGFLKMKSPL